MIDVRPPILVRLFRTRGRIADRFHIGRLQRKGMVRTHPGPPVQAASGRVVRQHIADTVGVWDPSGDRGRSELQALIRRAGQ